jgi:hypothetical protein
VAGADQRTYSDFRDVALVDHGSCRSRERDPQWASGTDRVRPAERVFAAKPPARTNVQPTPDASTSLSTSAQTPSVTPVSSACSRADDRWTMCSTLLASAATTCPAPAGSKPGHNRNADRVPRAATSTVLPGNQKLFDGAGTPRQSPRCTRASHRRVRALESWHGCDDHQIRAKSVHKASLA